MNAPWHVETDASVNAARRPGDGPRFPGGGIVLRNPDLEVKVAWPVELGYLLSPTHAEYAALLRGLEVALTAGVRF